MTELEKLRKAKIPVSYTHLLFLHRNTLQYRFRQVKDITGFDLRQIDDLLLLRLAVLRYQYHQPDRKD